MESVEGAILRRAGRTARYWTRENRAVEVGQSDLGIIIRTSMASKGGGITEVQIEITRAEFPRLLRLLAGSLEAA